VRDFARMNRLAPVLVVLALLSASDAFAQQKMLVGGKFGGNWNQLSQPADPAGEPTVLFGTAFTGYGFQVGATVYRELKRLAIGPIFVDADVLVAHQRGRGFAESRTSELRRDLVIYTTGLRIPTLVGIGIAGKASTIRVAAGPELLLGIAAGSYTKQTAGAASAGALTVRPVTHVGVTGQLGMTIESGSAKIPIDLRMTWDPFVPKSTRDRFSGYVDMNNTGEYQVAFNWQAFVMVGWLTGLGQ